MALAETIRTFPGMIGEPHIIEGKDLVGCTTSGAETGYLDTKDCGLVSVSINLGALTGGTTPSVDFRVQHSQDAVKWYEHEAVGSSLTLALPNASESYLGLHRYVRVAWTTNGAPSAASAYVAITAKRR